MQDGDAGTADGSTLVIQTAFLGDVVLTTPLLTILAEKHGRVDVCVTPGAAPLLEGHPAVHRVIVHDKRGAESGWKGVLSLAKRLGAMGYTRAYLPHQSWRSGLAAQLAGIPERIGFADAPARWTYTRKFVRPSGVHEVERLVALAGESTAPPISLGLSEADQAEADTWMDKSGVSPGFIAIAPGSVWATKKWGKYADLAASLNRQLVVIGGPEDAALAQDIVAVAPTRIFNSAGALPLRISAALLRRASMIVTNDSAPLHLAQAAGTPTVALFGPTVTRFGFGPRGPQDIVVEVPDLPCRPCSAHGPQRCPLGHHRCMRDLEVTTVAAAVENILTPT